jgi:cell shape-determining protein MreC
MTSKSSELVSSEQYDNENRRLPEENEQLRRLLAAHGIPVLQSSK